MRIVRANTPNGPTQYYQLTHDYLVHPLRDWSDPQTARDPTGTGGTFAGGTCGSLEFEARASSPAVRASGSGFGSSRSERIGTCPSDELWRGRVECMASGWSDCLRGSLCWPDWPRQPAYMFIQIFLCLHSQASKSNESPKCSAS